MIIVSKSNDGDYNTIQEAVDHAAEGDTIYIKEGIYHERVTVTTPSLTILGSNTDFRPAKALYPDDESCINTYLESDKTIISFGLYAKMPSEDIGKLGTFRTYTMFIDAPGVCLKNITVENSAGAGPEIGQAIALYAEGDDLKFENVRLLGWQDTLFTGPLPPKEIEKNGFIGPKQFAKRTNGVQYYNNCYIEGDIDFIFGSATAYFDDCVIFQKDRAGLLERKYRNSGPEVLNSILAEDEAREHRSYATAASTPEVQEYGYIFRNCRFLSDCPKESCYLGRPWRNYAHVAVLNCFLGPQIKPEGFHNWNKTDAESTVRFFEYKNYGPGSVQLDKSDNSEETYVNMKKRASFVRELSDKEAEKYTS
ncbi:MAG: pectin methylesterase [Lachnospiraceae bacterium]|nr:pectin methylesterase [Lachnospiraceae bacterium]